jgi:hypothetical protein
VDGIEVTWGKLQPPAAAVQALGDLDGAIRRILHTSALRKNSLY